MTAFRVVLDACVMLPQTLNNLLLTLADAEMFRPVWMQELLDEVQRNLTTAKFGKSPAQASRRVGQMRTAFPFAEEESRGYRELIPAMTNDPKDRHVLAAAVRSGASVIVTANLKDFPSDTLAPFDVEAVHPDDSCAINSISTRKRCSTACSSWLRGTNFHRARWASSCSPWSG